MINKRTLTNVVAFLLSVFISGLMLCTHAATAQAEDKKLPKACQEANRIKLQLKAISDDRLAGKLTTFQTECSAQQKKPRPWSTTCDDRSLRPGDLRIPRKIPGYIVYDVGTEKQKYDECVSNTKDRCVWQEVERLEIMLLGMYGYTDEQIEEEEKNPQQHVSYELRCPDGSVRAETINIVSAKQTSIHERAIEASLKLNLPKPSPQMTWLWQGEMPYTLVNGPTWFATDKQTFTNRSQYARAGNTWVQVTAVPAGLSFTANGEPETWCAGPGVDPRDKAHMNNLNRQNIRPLFQKPPGGCSHRFNRTSPGDPDQPVPGNMRIRWAISYVGSGNITGTLPDMYTNAPVGPFAITEMQTLVTK